TAPNPTQITHLSSRPSSRRLPLSLPDPDRRRHPSLTLASLRRRWLPPSLALSSSPPHGCLHNAMNPGDPPRLCALLGNHLRCASESHPCPRRLRVCLLSWEVTRTRPHNRGGAAAASCRSHWDPVRITARTLRPRRRSPSAHHHAHPSPWS
uniref:Uncharacterized protein n=1 Tax=Triticum urartu TaxID=4572 RepID=A0A8R7UCF2_TRIUA